jgi:uncharacterized protein involved in exopolysaccharide biosynthesis
MSYRRQYSHESLPEDGDAGSVIDYRALRNWVLFAARSVSRHRRLVLGAAAVTLLLASIAVLVLPKQYHVSTTLLAQKNFVLALPGEEHNGRSPTSAAVETILRRDNLEAIVRETNLVEEFSQRRAPLLKLKDFLTSPFRKSMTEAERVDGLVKYLQKQLKVFTDDGAGTVTIEIFWPDSQMAYRLVDAAKRGFLEARHVQETSTIAEQASILEGHAAELTHDIELVADIQALRSKKRLDKDLPAPPKNEPESEPPARRPVARVPAPALAAAPKPVDDSVLRRRSELSVMIEAKRRAMTELEEYRRKRIAELQGELESRRASYTDVHPAIVELKHAIQAASKESPQVSKLRSDLKELEGEFAALGGDKVAAPEVPTPRVGSGGTWSSTGASRHKLPGDVIRIEQGSAEERDPEIEYARSKLKFSINAYQALEEKIQRARIDLDTAEAAFKYRYTVVAPPEVPRGPLSPQIPLVLIAAAVCGLFVGLIGAVALDLRRGVFHESWQVEQFLTLPVLGSVEASRPRG